MMFSSSNNMSSNNNKLNVRKQVVLEKKSSKLVKEKEENNNIGIINTSSFFTKHMKRVYPIIGLQRSNSSLSLSSLSLSLSQNSNDSSLTEDNYVPLHRDISSVLRFISQAKTSRQVDDLPKNIVVPLVSDYSGELKRCNWITDNSDKVYVSFHDEHWGVPVYDDNELFELLAMTGMLMDYNWTEILKRKILFREAFSGFEAQIVAKMGENEIAEISANKSMMLAESRVRCIIDNAKCILRISREYGSFSSYIWDFVNYKPIINKYKHPRNVPLRSPKAEAMSKDLLKHGFRLVGPVIVHSFMQAAGLTIDHLVDCFRYTHCLGLAERPWRHI
ncbi:hypothetical protein ACFE04_002953 [Oxalis oulophora]